MTTRQMTIREYHEWISRQRARSRADLEFSAWMLACAVGGMASILWVCWLLAQWGGR